MKNLEIAQLYERTADVLAVIGEENPFRLLAYRKVARVLTDLPQDVEALLQSGEIANVPGIGESTIKKIREYLSTGKIAEFDDIAAQIPAGVVKMIQIPSVGPKTASLLWHEGGVTNVEDLLAKIDSGALKNIKGLGDKKLQKIKENIAHLATSAGRIRIGEALPIAESLVAALRDLKFVQNAMYCGSLRRGKETIGDIDIAVSADPKHGKTISDAVTSHHLCAKVIAAGETKTSFITVGSLQVDVRVVPPESWGSALQYFTGSQAHNVKLRELAQKKNLKLNEWGLFKTAGNKETRIAGETEEEIYKALGLNFIPPEMREDRGEIEFSALSTQHSVLTLVERADIRGDLHMHTTASDGANSIEEMVAEAKRRGYEYIAITDHSKSQFQANGLKSDRLLQHIKAIHAVAKEASKGAGGGILVLAGSEVDILADGSLDYEDELLAQLDWVVASPHAALSQEGPAATQRLITAAANPHVCVIGHPTGRIVPSRRGLEVDMPKVIFAAARNGIALEINANYHRLDLRDTHARLAVEAGVPLCINTDAHALAEFDQMIYGVLTARRAWAKKTDVLNTKPRPALEKWLKSRRDQAQW